MIWPFKRRPKSILGIDIGTSVIRVVELLKNGEQAKLVNYGFVSLAPLYEKTTKRHLFSYRQRNFRDLEFDF